MAPGMTRDEYWAFLAEQRVEVGDLEPNDFCRGGLGTSCHNLVMRRAAVIPDTNIWRYLVDAGAVELLRRSAKATGVDVVACPAVVYECLRVRDAALRKRLAKALTRTEWVRPMPEVFVECEDLRAEVARNRPTWLRSNPDLRNWDRNRNDWRGPFWRRVREQTPLMSRIIASLGDDDLDAARRDAYDRRALATKMKQTGKAIHLNDARSHYIVPMPGWDGAEFDTWRGYGEQHWWDVLFVRRHETFLDWLGAWIDLDKIQSDPAGWVSFWTRQVSAERLPREWVRWAMNEVQATRKVTSGTPVDNQIATYLPDYAVFITSDRGFAECIEALRPSAPVPLAMTSIAPAGAAVVEHVLAVLENLASVRGPH